MDSDAYLSEWRKAGSLYGRRAIPTAVAMPKVRGIDTNTIANRIKTLIADDTAGPDRRLADAKELIPLMKGNAHVPF